MQDRPGIDGALFNATDTSVTSDTITKVPIDMI